MTCASGLASAGDSAFSARGELTFQEDFPGGALAPEWIGKPGACEIADGAARAIHLSINNREGHVCRLMIIPTGMVLQTGKPAQLAVLEAVVEVRGRKRIAQLDGKRTVAGDSPLVDVEKTDLGFPSPECGRRSITCA